MCCNPVYVRIAGGRVYYVHSQVLCQLSGNHLLHGLRNEWKVRDRSVVVEAVVVKPSLLHDGCDDCLLQTKGHNSRGKTLVHYSQHGWQYAVQDLMNQVGARSSKQDLLGAALISLWRYASVISDRLSSVVTGVCTCATGS